MRIRPSENTKKKVKKGGKDDAEEEGREGERRGSRRVGGWGVPGRSRKWVGVERSSLALNILCAFGKGRY